MFHEGMMEALEQDEWGISASDDTASQGVFSFLSGDTNYRPGKSYYLVCLSFRYLYK